MSDDKGQDVAAAYAAVLNAARKDGVQQAIDTVEEMLVEEQSDVSYETGRDDYQKGWLAALEEIRGQLLMLRSDFE